MVEWMGQNFDVFSWFPENSLLCVILRYTVYLPRCHTQYRKLLLQLSLEFEAITNEFGCTTYLDWKTPKYELLSYRKLKPHESQVRPQQSFCNRDILFNFFSDATAHAQEL